MALIVTYSIMFTASQRAEPPPLIALSTLSTMLFVIATRKIENGSATFEVLGLCKG